MFRYTRKLVHHTCPKTFLTSTQQAVSSFMAEQLDLTPEKFAALTQLMHEYKLPMATNVAGLKKTLEPYAKLHGFYFSSELNQHNILKCAQRLGLCRSETITFAPFQYDLVIPDQPGFEHSEILRRLWKLPMPKRILTVMNADREFADEQIAAFKSNLDMFNSHLCRNKFPILGHESVKYHTDKGLSPVLQEVEAAEKFHAHPLYAEHVAVLLDQPRAAWLRETFLTSLRKFHPSREVQFSTQGVGEDNFLLRCLAEMACFVQMKVHKKKLMEENLNLIPPSQPSP